MSETVTHPSATAEEPSSLPLFETNLFFGDLLICISFATISVIAAIVCLYLMSPASWGGQLTMALFFLLIAGWILFTPHTFHLYGDKLVIKKPLTHLSGTTTVIPLSAIRQVQFTRFTGPRRGTFMRIKTHGKTIEYRITDRPYIDDMIWQLQQLGVKARRNIIS